MRRKTASFSLEDDRFEESWNEISGCGGSGTECTFAAIVAKEEVLEEEEGGDVEDD